jgi:hypothetical protein
MRTIYLGINYETKIYVIDEQKLIYKIDCMCGDFTHRRLKSIGGFSDIKIFAQPCKHLKAAVEALEKMGYKLKIPKEMDGTTTLHESLRKQLLERANFKCESPGCDNREILTIHRKIRGSNGGKYNMENCDVLCHKCHSNRHSKEF